jgi:protein involved in polysaccharide export with SLBB domain
MSLAASGILCLAFDRGGVNRLAAAPQRTLPQRIRLDLTDCMIADGRSLGAIARLQRRLESQGGDLALQNATPETRAVLDLAGLRIEIAERAMPLTPQPAISGRSRWRWLRRTAAVLFAMSLAACASMAPPENPDATFYTPAKGDDSAVCAGPDHHDQAIRTNVGDTLDVLGDAAPALSPGDRINVWIEDAAEFSSDYVVEPTGLVVFPLIPPVAAAGLTTHEVEEVLRTALVEAGIFRADLLKLAVRVVQFGPLDVEVQGAVFAPGRVRINEISPADKQDKALTRFGDAPLERRVTTALRAAGGVRPDARLADVQLIRGGTAYALDLRGVLAGAPTVDPTMMAGDRLIVPSADCFEPALVRPSSITPDGIRVFMSNLTAPARGNATAAIGQFAQSMPYGSKLLQAAVSANCVGGSLASNARRHVVLISQDPRSGASDVVQQPIEDLVRDAGRDSFNPYLMPNDAIACYDSAITDVREVAATMLSVLAPYGVARLSVDNF